MSEHGGLSDEPERRRDVSRRIYDLGDRVTRVETLYETFLVSQSALNSNVAKLVQTVQELVIKINTLETQRNTVVGVAGIIGALLTVLAQAIYRLIASASSRGP